MAPPPSLGLAEHVVCTWVAVREPGPSGPVLPDGCVDILWLDGRSLVVAGPDTGPVVEADLPVGGSVVGLRFRSGMAAAGLGVAVDDLRDTRTPLASVWPSAEVERLASRLAEAESPVAVLAAAVARRCRPVSGDDRLVRAAVGALRSGRPGSVAALAAGFEVGERRLHRRFSSAVGYGPKTLDRIFRFERFRRLAAASPAAGLAELAVEAGYSDQAHLTRECRRLAGTTPVRIVQDARTGGPIPSAV